MIGRIERVYGRKKTISQKRVLFLADFFFTFASETGLLESKEKKICSVDLPLKNSKMWRLRLLGCWNFLRFLPWFDTYMWCTHINLVSKCSPDSAWSNKKKFIKIEAILIDLYKFLWSYVKISKNDHLTTFEGPPLANGSW